MRWAHVAGGDVQCSGSVERDLVVGCFCGVESSQCKIHLAVSTLGDPLFFASMGLSVIVICWMKSVNFELCFKNA